MDPPKNNQQKIKSSECNFLAKFLKTREAGILKIHCSKNLCALSQS
jgi:hypothetical protein